MKLLRPHPMRLARRFRQFNLSLVAALAALALTGCGNEREPVQGASSIGKGVQQILQSRTLQPSSGNQS